MSFKREGDDPSQLNVLKKRRVADLLASYIPEDEALLLRDGRYSCTVCFHRPVFDTLDMLTVHRSGKKHLASLQRFYGRKQRLWNETQKRKHQAHLRAEEEAGGQDRTAAGPAPLLVQTRKIAQNALLKSAPYSSCCRRNRDPSSDVGPSTSKISDGSRCPEQGRLPEPTGSIQSSKEASLGPEAMPDPRLPGSTTTKTGLLERSRPKKKHPQKGKASLAKHRPSSPVDLTPEKRQALEHYLKLKSSGWIQDCSGKWVKDENVEFDSDEEAPPAPTPS